MIDWLAQRAAITPHRLAISCQGETWSYERLSKEAELLARGLTAWGVTAGQRVAVHLPSDPYTAALIHALARIGALFVPLNTRLSDRELLWQLDHGQAHWLVSDEVWTVPPPQPAIDLTLVRQLGLGQQSRLPRTPFRMSAYQAIIYTSGTAGRPKGAVLTWNNLYWSAMASADRLGVQAHDIWLSSLPFYHVGGMAVLWRCCLYGTAMALLPRFDLQAFQSILEGQAITMTSLVPTMLHRLLAQDVSWPSSLRFILLGGAAASPQLLRQAQRKALPLAPTYGFTEAASQVATMIPQGTRTKPGSVGRPLKGFEIAIWDDQYRSLPAGERGQIVVRGAAVMSTYWRDRAATARAFRDGWFLTGDVGFLDAVGDLWVLQRREDLIISGGENIYPAEVERILEKHPAISAACIVGLSDEEWGKRLAAVVIPVKGKAITAEELIAYCRSHLAGFKVPKTVHFIEQFPLTSSGKIRRRALQEELELHLG